MNVMHPRYNDSMTLEPDSAWPEQEPNSSTLSMLQGLPLIVGGSLQLLSFNPPRQQHQAFRDVNRHLTVMLCLHQHRAKPGQTTFCQYSSTLQTPCQHTLQQSLLLRCKPQFLLLLLTLQEECLVCCCYFRAFPSFPLTVEESIQIYEISFEIWFRLYLLCSCFSSLLVIQSICFMVHMLQV